MIDEDLSETCEACGGEISAEAVDRGDVLKASNERFWHEDCPTGSHTWEDRRDSARRKRGLEPEAVVPQTDNNGAEEAFYDEGNEVVQWRTEDGDTQQTLGRGTEPNQNERKGYRNQS